MNQHPVVIVGAGLAGLACAVRLHRAGLNVVVLESETTVGGRIRTEVVDGFTIDRGFQVLNTAYPALRRSVDLEALNLRTLPRGVRVHRNGQLHAVPHPLASASAPWTALTSGVTDIRGKLAVAGYAGRILASPVASIRAREDVSAATAWSRSLPERVIRDVVEPFLTGVVLEEEFTTSRVFTDLMMRMFALGSSAVPAAGMQALPEHLASQLPPAAFRLASPVAGVSPMSVTLADGVEVGAQAVVVATDPWTAHQLVPELGAPAAARGVTTHYFATPVWSGLDGTLVVDAERGPITNSVVLTASAPEYSQDGRALIATSTIHRPGTEQPDIDTVRRAAAALHQAPHDDWELVATREIPHALPAMTAPHPLKKPAYVPDAGLWVTGDHRDTSSIQGALVSGSRVAAALVTQLTGPTSVRSS